MKDKYFNKFEFKLAVELLEKNPELSRIKFEEYLKKFPYDYTAYTYYISCLITLGNLDEAENYLNYLKNISYIDNNFKSKTNKMSYLNKNLLFAYIKLLCYQHKYEELYSICIENISLIEDMNLTSVFFYCKEKLNMIDKNSRSGKKYIHKQMIDYQERDFFDHIKKHLANFNKDLSCPNPSIFACDFPITTVIENIKKLIPSSKRIFSGFYDDTYFFKYDCCGKENNKYTNYIKVVCFHDTNNIITMCPALNCENLPYVDLNYLVQNQSSETAKSRKISQIDKFNKRYNLN